MVDNDLLEIIKRMNNSSKNLKDSSKLLKKVLGLPQNRIRNIFAKALSSVIPNALQEYVPDSVTMFIGEEFDILVFTENKIRENTTDAQVTANDMATMATDLIDQFKQARAELAKAIEEDWNTKQLREYLSEKVGIEVDSDVDKLLDDRYDYLPPEEQKRRKENILKGLDGTINNMREFCKVITNACAIQLDTLDALILQLYNFVYIHRPLAVLRNAGTTMTENAKAIFAASAVVQDTFERSLRVTELIVEAASMFDKYAISSANMNQKLVAGTKRLEIGLAKLEQSKNKSQGQIKLLPDKTKIESLSIGPSQDDKPVEKTIEAL